MNPEESSYLHTHEAQPSENKDPIALTSNDFHFINHRNPDRLFREINGRPLRLFKNKPSLTHYSNAIYTPVLRAPKEHSGCLYDEQLQRIDMSCVYRLRKDEMWNTDTRHFNEGLNDLPVYERPLLYMGWLKSHFGHFLLETLPRWWPLVEDLDEIEGFLFHVETPQYLERSHIKACLTALQVNSESIIYFDRPTRLKSVVVPELSYQIGSHIYTAYQQLFNKLAFEFGAEKLKQTDQPLYLSRSLVPRGMRTYIGEEKIEDFLAKRSVYIAHPEQLPFTEQIRLVNKHRHILGFQGSQMYNIAGALEPKKVTLMADENLYPDWFLVNKCFEHDATFANVCRRMDSPASRLGRILMEKIRGRKGVPQGFEREYEVNIDQAIALLSAIDML